MTESVKKNDTVLLIFVIQIGLMYKIFLIGYIILFFASMVNSFAAKPLVVTFDKDDYNASSKNWSVAVNSIGLVYVGNHAGLLEGDGQTWKLYKLPVGGVVRSVAVDKNDRVYTGSFEEFGFWEADNTGELHYTSLRDSLSEFDFHNEQIWKIIIRDKRFTFRRLIMFLFTMTKMFIR